MFAKVRGTLMLTAVFLVLSILTWHFGPANMIAVLGGTTLILLCIGSIVVSRNVGDNVFED